tara:strand:+ start:718 stop:1239 length:522 start_codon:yes stop_codon:yes gene_type:complete
MTSSLIVAVSENNVIGTDNTLPWNLPNDMKYFKEKTTGHSVIMGRKNFDSIPIKYRPLKNRKNIILSRNPNFFAKDCVIVNSIEEGLNEAKKNNDTESFIIGGGEIYKIALEKNLIDRIYLTRIHAIVKGDTYFPELNKTWKMTYLMKNQADEKHRHDFTFYIYERNSSEKEI